MPRLFVLGGPDVGRSYEVREGMVLGRHPDCTVQVHDRSVSRKHARLEREGGRWFVVDLGSRNGVRVHGERIERAELTDLDEFLLGELLLRFRNEEPAPPAASAPTPAPAPAPAPTPAPAPRAAPAPRPRAPADEEPGGLELEEEIDLTALAQTSERPAPLPAATPVPTEREVQRARILRENAGGGGFLSGDLAQRPLWVRALVTVFVLAVAAGLFWGAFKLVQMMRGTL